MQTFKAYKHYKLYLNNINKKNVWNESVEGEEVEEEKYLCLSSLPQENANDESFKNHDYVVC